MSRPSLYLDYSATTPVRPEVLAAMLPYFSETFANPSSVHAAGLEANQAVGAARRTLARILGIPPTGVVFTAGGTEADVLALRGALRGAAADGAVTPPAGARRSIVLSAIEHHAVLETARCLEGEGAEARIVPVDADGCVDPAAVEAALDDGTVLVSIMHVNNETGAVQPVAELSRRVKQRNPRTLVHVDAVQSFGRYPVSFADWPDVDLIAVAAHKIYGPKGVGALFVRPGTRLLPIITGGGQEHGLRSGTHNVPGIVGLAEAARLLEETREADMEHYAALARRFLDGLAARVPDAHLNGARDDDAPWARRAPYIINVCFRGAPTEALHGALSAAGIAVSAGSACHSKDGGPSHVLCAMGTGEGACLRFSLGRPTTAADVDVVLDTVVRALAKFKTTARA
ncbi:MAG: cysteine desulfurase family protein [Candidatus Eisenbacteria bacterium]